MGGAGACGASIGAVEESPDHAGLGPFPDPRPFAGEYVAPVFVDSDVSVMALGEHWGGVGKGVDNLLFVKIGTGIGGGIIADGRLYRGAQGCAGDIGHICVDPEGPVCSCGNRGCLEAMAAAPAIVRKAERCARDGIPRSSRRYWARKGSSARGTSARRRASGTTRRSRSFVRPGRLVGGVLATLVSTQPALIVIGGGVANMGHSLLAEIRSTVYRRPCRSRHATFP